MDFTQKGMVTLFLKLLTGLVIFPLRSYAQEPCASNPCTNGGTCQSFSGIFLRCVCTTGWTGTTCSQRGPCASNPCANGGTCMSFSGLFFMCECATGWTGTTCSRPEGCVSQPCRNGGRCTSYGSIFDCDCASGWRGRTCSTPGMAIGTVSAVVFGIVCILGILYIRRTTNASEGTRARVVRARVVRAPKQASSSTIEIPNPAFTSDTALNDNHRSKDAQPIRQRIRTKLPLPTVEDCHGYNEEEGNYEEIDKYEDLNHPQDSIHYYVPLDEYMEIVEPPDG